LFEGAVVGFPGIVRNKAPDSKPAREGGDNQSQSLEGDFEEAIRGVEEAERGERAQTWANASSGPKSKTPAGAADQAGLFMRADYRGDNAPQLLRVAQPGVRVNQYPYRPEQVREALRAADGDLVKWVKSRPILSPTSPYPINGTSADDNYYYRAGGLKTANPEEGWGLTPEAFERAKVEVMKAGMPKLNRLELQHINRLHYDAFREQYPDRKLILKAYPGGPTETTEREPLHFDNKSDISNALHGFDFAFAPGKQPWGIMLNHASHNLDAFPGMGTRPLAVPDILSTVVKKGLHLPDSASPKEAFSQIPASLNPLITQYLREDMGYKGVIVGDWYNMGAIRKTCAKFIEPLKSLANINDPVVGEDDVALFMGVMSGVNYIRPQLAHLINQNFWSDFPVKAPDAYKAFNDKLNNVILSTYNTLKTSTDPEKTLDDINKLEFKDKLELITSSTLGGNQQETTDRDEARFDRVKASFPDKALFEVINDRNRVIANDVWDRTGIMTMQHRKSVIDHLTGKHYPDAPLKAESELAWLTGLRDNPDFAKAYKAVYGNNDAAWRKLLGLDPG
jgi:Glycosyl hydrolase family 3 N terminal domain